jgi:hypothetical protein
MDHIIEINRRSVFTLEEAQELLPVVFRITKCYSLKVEALLGRLNAIAGHNEGLVLSLETQVSDLVQEWQNKVQKLGALPKGLWIADFDSGDGYFCWKYPERSIEFWHKYTDGFSKRVHVDVRRAPISLKDRLRKKIMSPVPISLQPSEITD